MRKHLLMTMIAMSAFAATAVAGGYEARAAAKQVIELKDGSTLYIFKDGKMAMEDKLGRTVNMKKDTVMETKDGRKIIMHGDEVMRLERLLRTPEEAG